MFSKVERYYRRLVRIKRRIGRFLRLFFCILIKNVNTSLPAQSEWACCAARESYDFLVACSAAQYLGSMLSRGEDSPQSSRSRIWYRIGSFVVYIGISERPRTISISDHSSLPSLSQQDLPWRCSALYHVHTYIPHRFC
jgi:hypothetical protein